MSENWFWEILAIVCTIWYSTITIYVAYKGWYDIQHMLRDLRTNQANRPVEK